MLPAHVILATTRSCHRSWLRSEACVSSCHFARRCSVTEIDHLQGKSGCFSLVCAVEKFLTLYRVSFLSSSHQRTVHCTACSYTSGCNWARQRAGALSLCFSLEIHTSIARFKRESFDILSKAALFQVAGQERCGNKTLAKAGHSGEWTPSPISFAVCSSACSEDVHTWNRPRCA